MAPRPHDFHLIEPYERTFDVLDLIRAERAEPDWRFIYTFGNFFHPFAGELLEELNKESLPGMLDPAFHARLEEDPAADY